MKTKQEIFDYISKQTWYKNFVQTVLKELVNLNLIIISLNLTNI